MMTWLRKRNREIMILTFGTFLMSGVVFTGIQGFSLSPYSPVLVVNGEKVPYKRFETLLTRHMDRQNQEGGPMTPEKTEALKNSILQELAQETVFLQEADRYGLRVTDGELAAFIQSAPPFQRDGRFDQSLYLNYITQILRTSPSAFEDEQRRALRRQKLTMLLSSSIKVSEGEAADYMRRQRGQLPEDQRKALEKDPEKLRHAVGEEQANAAFQSWIQRLNEKLKMESRLDRWEKHAPS